MASALATFACRYAISSRSYVNILLLIDDDSLLLSCPMTLCLSVFDAFHRMFFGNCSAKQSDISACSEICAFAYTRNLNFTENWCLSIITAGCLMCFQTPS